MRAIDRRHSDAILGAMRQVALAGGRPAVLSLTLGSKATKMVYGSAATAGRSPMAVPSRCDRVPLGWRCHAFDGQKTKRPSSDTMAAAGPRQ